MNVDETIKDRDAKYGDFDDWAKLTQAFRNAAGASFFKLDPSKQASVSAIFDKLARILNGDPDLPDNWHDIAGYATLIERRLPDNSLNLTKDQIVDKAPPPPPVRPAPMAGGVSALGSSGTANG